MTAYRHIIFLIVIVAFLAAFLLFIPGCLLDEDDSRGVLIIKGLKSPSPSLDKAVDEMKFETGNPEFDKILDDMKFENAPTLGPVARKYFVAMFKGEWEKVWDMWSSETQKSFEKMWEFVKTSGSDEGKERANKAGSAKECYVLRMKKTEQSEEEWVKQITIEKFKFEVTGEEIEEDGKTGWIKVKYLKTGEEEKMFRLVKEGDEWKTWLGWW